VLDHVCQSAFTVFFFEEFSDQFSLLGLSAVSKGDFDDVGGEFVLGKAEEILLEFFDDLGLVGRGAVFDDGLDDVVAMAVLGELDDGGQELSHDSPRLGGGSTALDDLLDDVAGVLPETHGLGMAHDLLQDEDHVRLVGSLQALLHHVAAVLVVHYFSDIALELADEVCELGIGDDLKDLLQDSA
jgi:hypothetical protein